ncbi:MAG: N-acyl-D-amino-acid deacylase family protein [bacterium]
MADLDLIIKNALIYDGSGGAPYRASIGVSGDRIAALSPELHGGLAIIDGDGLCASPGFVDTHSHSEFTMLQAPSCESKILQGVTTEINGNCGLSAAPLLGDAHARREDDQRELGISERWSTMDEYFTLLRERKHMINYATLVGHGNIRGSVMGYRNKHAEAFEMTGMAELLSQVLESGVFGLSTGLIYPPGIFTSAEELIELLRLVKHNGSLVYATHMRSEGDRLVESVSEAIRIGRDGGFKIHISHLKTAGKDNWRKIDEVLGIIDEARSEGQRITFDRYPYTAAATDLDTVLPSWAYEGGNDQELLRLADNTARKKLIDHMRSRYKERNDYKSIFVSSVVTEKNKWTEGKSILEIAEARRVMPEDAVIDLLIGERIRVSAIFESMSEDNLRRFLKHPLCMVGSDSAVRNFSGITATGKPHPRAFGTFPRYLGRYIIGEKLMPLAEGIRRMTSLPAETFGIYQRGRIQEGNFADIVLFDPQRVSDRATYADPFQKPEGIRTVIVNGAVAVDNGEIQDGVRPGRILRRSELRIKQ